MIIASMNSLCKTLLSGLSVCLAMLALHTQTASATDSFAEMFTEGEFAAALRYRYEFVDQDVFAKDARASTLRGRLNFKTGDWNGFGAFAEFDYVTDVIWDDYNAGSGNNPDKTQYPTVADPTGEDLNQLYLQWQDDAAQTLVRGGRQRIIYDNGRFIGNVGWRQNEQTYDSVYFQKKLAALDFQIAYVWQVNRIFGNDVPAGKDDNQTWLLNLGHNWEGLGKLSAYYYDIDNEDVAASSTRSYGARFAGTRALGKNAFGYTLDFANQTDAHNNAVDYSASYFRIDASLTIGKITPYLGYESLGGDANLAGASFRTPLATLHAFNGWADLFLTTPDAGLNDAFAGIKGALAAWNWDVLYHEFDAESGSQSFGSEIDTSLSRQFAERYNVLFKAAFFDGENSSAYSDTTKFWVQLTADF